MTLRNSPSGPSSVTFTGLTNQTVAALAAAGDSLTQSIAVPAAKIGDLSLVTSAALLTAGVVPNGPGTCAVAGTVLQSYTATKAYGGAANVDLNVATFHTG